MTLSVSNVSPKEVPAALIAAIRSELSVLITEGSLDDNLPQIERVAQRARELFITLKGPVAQLQSNQSVGFSSYNASSTYVIGSGGAAGTVYPNPEQFGAKTMRELISLISEFLDSKSNTPDKIVEAIAIAKMYGEEAHDVNASPTTESDVSDVSVATTTICTDSDVDDSGVVTSLLVTSPMSTSDAYA